MLESVKTEPETPAEEAASITGSPVVRRGGRAINIRRALPERERSPLPSPMQNRTSTVAVSRIGTDAEREELVWMFNSRDSAEWGDDHSSEWGDDRDEDQLIGTRHWTETTQDELTVTYRSNFHQNSYEEVKVHDTCDRPVLRKLEDLKQLTRSGETIERGDALRRMHVKISLSLSLIHI